MGGALAESFQYHRIGGQGTYVPHGKIAPPNDKYGDGFPVQNLPLGLVWRRALIKRFPAILCGRAPAALGSPGVATPPGR
jgi:hypothetical protein